MTENNFSPFQINTQPFFLNFFFSQNGCRRPFWMTENHFRSHFSPFQINMQLLFLPTKWLPAAILDDRKSLSIAFLAISIHNFFYIFFKMAAGGHFGNPIFAKNNRALPLCVINAYAKYELDRWNRDATSFLTKLWPVQALACGGDGGGGGGVSKNIVPQTISNFGDIIIPSSNYNYGFVFDKIPIEISLSAFTDLHCELL